MAAVSQTTLSNAFSWMKMLEFRLRVHWSLFLRVQLTIFLHWFRKWLGAGQATKHYLNQWWLVYWRIYASLGLNELRPGQNGRHFADANFKCNFLNTNVLNANKIALRYIHGSYWRYAKTGPGNEPMMANICDAICCHRATMSMAWLSKKHNHILVLTILNDLWENTSPVPQARWFRHVFAGRWNCILVRCWLTHWGRVTHICITKLTNIGSDNGLSPGRRQAII